MTMTDFITVAEAAVSAGTNPEAVRAFAIRNPDSLVVYLLPPPGGLHAYRLYGCVRPPRGTEEFTLAGPDLVVVTEPTRLDVETLMDHDAGRSLRVVPDGAGGWLLLASACKVGFGSLLVLQKQLSKVRGLLAPEPDLLTMRLTASRDALIPVEWAVKLLPMKNGEARAWLKRSKLISKVNGRDVVLWGDVLDARIRASAARVTTPTAPARRPRVSLRD